MSKSKKIGSDNIDTIYSYRVREGEFPKNPIIEWNDYSFLRIRLVELFSLSGWGEVSKVIDIATGKKILRSEIFTINRKWN